MQLNFPLQATMDISVNSSFSHSHRKKEQDKHWDQCFLGRPWPSEPTRCLIWNLASCTHMTDMCTCSLRFPRQRYLSLSTFVDHSVQVSIFTLPHAPPLHLPLVAAETLQLGISVNTSSSILPGLAWELFCALSLLEQAWAFPFHAPMTGKSNHNLTQSCGKNWVGYGRAQSSRQ